MAKSAASLSGPPALASSAAQRSATQKSLWQPFLAAHAWMAGQSECIAHAWASQAQFAQGPGVHMMLDPAVPPAFAPAFPIEPAMPRPPDPPVPEGPPAFAPPMPAPPLERLENETSLPQ